MAVMRVVSADDVRARMSMSAELTENEDAINDAIGSAQQRLEGEYGMVFDLTTVTDKFYIYADMFHGVRPKGFNQLMLSKPFVSQTAGVTVKYGHQLTDTSDVFVPAHVDYPKGVVFLGEEVSGKYVEVSYTAGFASKAEVPLWIKEAVLAYAPVMFNLGTPVTANLKSFSGVDAYQKQITEHVKAMLISRHRNTGFMFKPL